jgi:acetyl-CoA carboxylase biotin carboxylase subunit
MFDKVSIANRGEIALRIQRACRAMGLKTVVIHSEIDRDARYVGFADQALCIGQASASRTGVHRPGEFPRCR